MHPRVKYKTNTYIENPYCDERSKFYHNGQDKRIINVNSGNLKKDPNFPVAKYIVVVKIKESKHTYIYHGKQSKAKLYGIGILTTKNRYYFSQLFTREVNINHAVNNQLKEIFTRGYIINQDTRIVFSDNMDRKYDPVWLFLGIIGSQVGINIHTKSVKMQIRRINAYLGYLKTQNYVKFESNYQIGLFMKKLFKNNRFDFIPDPYFKERLNDGTVHEKNMKIRCALGILYLFAVDMIKKGRRGSEERRKLKLGLKNKGLNLGLENKEYNDPVYKEPE